jgi:hypothetical protein
MKLKVGTKFTPIILVPSIESWVPLATVESEIILDVGEQILRLEVIFSTLFNVDKITISQALNITESKNELSISLYPNPIDQEGYFEVYFPNNDQVSIDVFSLLG